MIKRSDFNIAFALILLAFQTACGQTQPQNAGSNVRVLTSNVKNENNADIKTDAAAIKAAYPNLKPQADEMRKAFLAEDFDKYTDFMHPVTYEAVGGREKFISNLRSSIANIRSNGAEFVSYEIGEPRQAIEMDNKLFVVLPYETKMKNPQKTATEEGNILAVSDDKGEKWNFIRATSKERLRFLFPKLVDKLDFSQSRMK